MIRTPLRYPGGKTRIAHNLAKLSEGRAFKEYREPFLGGGSVFLAFQESGCFEFYWLNDIYSPLTDFWNYAIFHSKELKEKVQSTFDTKHQNREIIFKELKKQINTENSLECASSFFVLNRITFSGTIEAGGFSKAAFSNRFTQSSIDRMEKLKVLAKLKINITNMDYKDVINWPGERVLIFLDPPYYSAQKSRLYGKNGRNHNNFDFQELANILRKTKHSWIMTIDDSKYIRDLFGFAYLNEFKLVYTMGPKKNKSKIGKELLLSNFKVSSGDIAKYTKRCSEERKS